MINQILQKNYKPKHSSNKLVTDNDETLINTEDICNELNNFFINIVLKWLQLFQQITLILTF